MNCFFCKGSLKDSTTNHVVNLDDGVIVVKNVPCTECAQCGESWYDDAVAMRLEQIVAALKSTALTEIAVVKYTDKVA
ncbi:MAG: type II toxin-antitoxin system MqsA family antitoxin [Oscillospiraceae bacterium]|jgi:YgiT-type zinc finger domain-containing protein|nr:type II toxin-antitoxin system MqsA family antitoxin [Oscillospiraceae bacterium]